MKQAIPVFFSINSYYTPFAGVAIKSLVENASETYSYIVRVLHKDLTTENIIQLEALSSAKVHIICVNVSGFSETQELGAFNRFSEEALYRICIPKWFPNIEKAIYLDSDIIVRSDLYLLYNVPIVNYAMGVVRDYLTAYEETYVKKYVEIDVNKYFNSGVLLLNCDYFRKKDLLSKCLDIYRSRKELRYLDQDILNIVCADQVLYLEQGWNLQRHHMDHALKEEYAKNYVRGLDEMHILHFTSEKKPWAYTDIQFAEEFWKYAAKTSFFYEILKKGGEMRTKNRTDYSFPMDLVERSSRVIIYGAGEVGKAFIGQVESTNYCNVVAWADRNYRELIKKNDLIINPQEINEYNYDYLIIAIVDEEVAGEIRANLEQMGIPPKKIIWKRPIIKRYW